MGTGNSRFLTRPQSAGILNTRIHLLPNQNFMKRVQSIDIIRGLVMIIMILDHVRDFFHEHSITRNPTDLTTATTAEFLTRWITHLCAPAFVMLAGVSAFQKYQGMKDASSMKRYLFKRGLILLLLEFTVVNFGVWMDPGFHTIIFEVIGAIALGFIVLSLVLDSSKTVLITVGALVLILQQVFQLIPLDGIPVFKTVFGALTQITVFETGPGRVFVVGYPPMQWISILLIGYGIAPVFTKPDQNRFISMLGLSFLGLFLVLRFINLYGDPLPWKEFDSAGRTFLSFINISKYPPSLQFVLLTLGIIFLLLSVADRFPSGARSFLTVYGKEPLFFFLLHWYIIHPAMLILLLVNGIGFDQMNFGPFGFGRPASGAGGVSLPWVYLVWAVTVMIFYSLCKWYHRRQLAKKASSAPPAS
jgi:uncharacterized membrane protein